ncbi:MAG: hypothetical protein COB20_14065 [SAR86 cluster bacterium]|uniref:DUF1315 family protein n=1 Tax=SAR86 cluster bacterium TaxID=2030880 RepID=A0A2A4WY53_9GAMM|nr:MAG: hypothetical protein COB20_14065 [SAR86 cluster bacterium]
MPDSKQQGFDELFMRRPASVEQLIDEMNLDVYESLKLAIELGKWSDGVRLDAEQIDFCMQTIILYEAKHLPEQERIGFDLSASCKSKAAPEQTQIISIVTNAKDTKAKVTSNSPMNEQGFKEGIEEGNKA